MKDMSEKIILAVLSILALVTKEMRQSRMSESVKAQCPHIISSLLLISKVSEEVARGMEVRD